MNDAFAELRLCSLLADDLVGQLGGTCDKRDALCSTADGEQAALLSTGSASAKGGLSALGAVKATYPRLMAGGTAECAAYGAASGYGTGEGVEDRIGRAATLGAGVGGAAGAVGGRVANRGARTHIPSTDELHDAASAPYKAADDAGLVLSPQSVNRLEESIRSNLSDFGYHPALNPKVGVLFQNSGRRARSQSA